MPIDAGTRVTSATAHGKHGHSLINDAKFRQLYQLALVTQHASRREKRLRDCQAALAGVAADLLSTDVIVAAHAASVDDIARGHVAPRMDRRSFEERVIEALSDAVGDRMRKTRRITAIFFDSAPNSPVLHEARALAIAAKLPVLLIQTGSPSPARARSHSKKKKRAPLEYPSIPVDAHDVIAMYRVAHESIERARDGGGPTHIVGVRWQLAAAKQPGRAAKTLTPDAVRHLEEWLITRGLPAQQWRNEIVAQFESNPVQAARQSKEQAFAAPNKSASVRENPATNARAIA